MHEALHIMHEALHIGPQGVVAKSHHPLTPSLRGWWDFATTPWGPIENAVGLVAA